MAAAAVLQSSETRTRKTTF